MSGFATPRRDKHGAWTGLGADIDKAIRARLARGDSIVEIAEAVGVAEGYVRAIATEGEGDAPPPGKKHLRSTPAPGEIPVAASRVHCLVAGEEIGARECISRQCSQKCFCPKASFAINAIAPTVLPGTRLEDELARCRAVARSVLLKGNVEERHFGPALVALRGGKPVPAPLIAGELPAPPKPEEKTGGAPQRRSPEARVLPMPPDPEPDVEDEPEFDSVAVARADVSGLQPGRAKKPIQPAPPAKEEVMPRTSKLNNVSDDEFRKTFAKHGNNAQAVADEYGVSWATVRNRCVKLDLSTRPKGSNGHVAGVKSAKPPRVAKSPPSAPAIPEDIVGLLQRQRDHYQAQVARIDRALAALRE